MDYINAFELIRTLGSISSIVSAYWAIRNTGRVPDENAKFQILAATQAAETDPEAVQFAQSLPKDLGEAANRRLNKAYWRYLKAWDSPMNALELDKESELAAWEICAALRLLKKHNGGALPLEEWQNLWKTFNCDKEV